jgi:hypothetical protein
MLGINQPSYLRLTINDGNGLNGFNSNSLTGLSRLLLTLQSQAYAPWDILGFRFGPYMNVSLGMLSDQNGGFGNSRVYTQIGFGMLIRNDYLVFKHFQISFAFYPSIPGKGNNVLKLNPFKTTDFGLPEFSMGKPQVVEYQ